MALFYGTTYSREEFAKIDISLNFLKQQRLPVENLVAANMYPCSLKGMGADNCDMLCELGFGSVNLYCPRFATQAVGMYGSKEVIRCFLKCPRDAVTIAGANRTHVIDVKTEQLLSACKESPSAAAAVLQLLGSEGSLVGVQAQTLIMTGLRKHELQQLSFGIKEITQQLNLKPNHNQLQQLGFRRNGLEFVNFDLPKRQ